MQLCKRLTLQVLLCASVSLLVACATTTALDAIERVSVCAAWKPTYWKASWPDDAIEQGKDNNARRKTMCQSVRGDVQAPE